ncbi:MAG: hypothetical protein GTO60_16760 [Gammaproteobacteria bacterium]|nr:hypothetical protein [Gammaproteobacteria bacterium]
MDNEPNANIVTIAFPPEWKTKVRNLADETIDCWVMEYFMQVAATLPADNDKDYDHATDSSV